MRLDELERELRAERPEPDPEFCRELDEWAAAGFPSRRGSAGDRLARRWSDARRRLGGLGPRRLVPALSMAGVSIVVIGVAIGQSGIFNGDGDRPALTGAEPAVVEDAPIAEPALPTTDAGGGETSQELRKSGRHLDFGLRADRGFVAGDLAKPLPRGSRQAQDVDLTLSTGRESFRETADGVLDVIDQQGGFVLRSNVSGGDPDVKGSELGQATFELRVPARNLQATIAALSDLGNVVSRTDGARDITGRFNDARQRIATFTASRDRLLAQLEDAFTATEQESIRRRLEIVEAQLARARDDLAAAQQRVRLVPLSVTVTGDGAEKRDDGAWGIGDAFDDAKRVVTVAAGVALVSAAALLPLALLAIVIAATRRAWVTREREKALDEGAERA